MQEAISLFISVLVVLTAALCVIIYTKINDATSNMKSQKERMRENELPKVDDTSLDGNLQNGRPPSIKTRLVSESCSVTIHSYQCPKCHGRGVLVDPTDTSAIKCHICKGEGRVEL